MSSSSRRCTEQESDLHAAYIGAGVRVLGAERRDLFSNLTRLFVSLLDINSQHLIDVSYDRRSWRSEVTACKDFTGPGKVISASRIIYETGWMLMKQYGREAESVYCFEFADTLRFEAEVLYEHMEKAREWERRNRMAADMQDVLET